MSGVNTVMDAVLEVQFTLYITMGELTSRGVPHVRLMEVELAGSTITGEGYAVKKKGANKAKMSRLNFILTLLFQASQSS